MKTTNTPSALNVDCGLVPNAVSRYMAIIGRTRRTKMTDVIIRTTSLSTLDLV